MYPEEILNWPETSRHRYAEQRANILRNQTTKIISAKTNAARWEES